MLEIKFRWTLIWCSCCCVLQQQRRQQQLSNHVWNQIWCCCCNAFETTQQQQQSIMVWNRIWCCCCCLCCWCLSIKPCCLLLLCCLLFCYSTVYVLSSYKKKLQLPSYKKSYSRLYVRSSYKTFCWQFFFHKKAAAVFNRGLVIISPFLLSVSPKWHHHLVCW